MVDRRRLALALPGIGGGIFAVLIGSIILLFSFASFGRHGAIAPSPAAGGLLYILLGFVGFIGAALQAGSSKAVKTLAIIGCLASLVGLGLSIYFSEWTACIIILISVIAVFAALRTHKSTALLLFVGVFGFLVGQEAMIFLLCGWKTWTIQGMLFILGSIIPTFSGYGKNFPLMNSENAKIRLKGFMLYSALCLAALVVLIFLLISLPDEHVGAAAYSAEARIDESFGRYDAAIEAYDRLIEVNQSDANAWYSKGHALEALSRHDESLESYGIAGYLSSSGSSMSSLNEQVQNSRAQSAFTGWGSAKGAVVLNDCDCALKRSMNSSINNYEDELKTDTDQNRKCSECKNNSLKASILSPGDVRTFPLGETITFEGSAACGTAPYTYLWDSSINGIIGNAATFNRSDLSIGTHTINLTITDAAAATATDSIDIGISSPSVCGNVNPRPKYYPIDTPCGGIWPNSIKDCMEFEVCHPDLDYIVVDAINCCDGTPTPGSACYYANANSGGDKKKCRALYIIKAFGPEAKYMQGYALFKACCSGYPECTRTCGLSLAGTCAFREGFNKNVTGLSCNPQEWGVDAWKSDDNMSQNSAVLGLFPTHATVNILHTGVCIDYSAAVTTLLRKAGYSRTEVLSTAATSYDLMLLGNHPGHAYGLIKLPGDSNYHFVDTTGNGEGINMSSVPRYFWFTGCFLGIPVKIKVFDWWVGYCNKTSSLSYNDAGYFNTPQKSCLVGCS